VAAASLRGAGRQGGFEGGADLGAAGVPTPLLLRLVEHAGLLCPSLLFGRGWSMRAPPPSLPPVGSLVEPSGAFAVTAASDRVPISAYNGSWSKVL